MEMVEYERFTEALRQRLEGDGRVVGLVALGSMAGREYGPDVYSDHDFFVVTRPGEQEAFRREGGWLPEAGRRVLWLRETAHGVKCLYESGHLLEFAVFDVGELSLAKVNRYRVLLDRGGVEEAVRAVAERTAGEGTPDDGWLLVQFLTQLVVGAGRHARGERLAGHSRVKEHALRHLLVLLARHVPAEHGELLDGLEPVRRFERAFPQLGRELGEALEQPTPRAARMLLGVAERELRPRVGEVFPAEGFAAVGAWLEGRVLGG